MLGEAEETKMMILSSRDAGVTTITLNRSERANAYNAALLDELEAALDAVETPVVLFAANGRAFCGGADLREMSHATPEDARNMRSQRLFERIASAPFVSIAAVQGPAVAGGFELCLACDLRVVGPNATFSLPETALGLVPAAGGSTRLPLLVGASRAKQVILGGDSIDAETALAWGVANRLAENPLAEALAWAHELSKRDIGAMTAAKRLLGRELSEALEAEREAAAALYAVRNNKA